jgi:small-conductance mechanosensitive channel
MGQSASRAAVAPILALVATAVLGVLAAAELAPWWSAPIPIVALVVLTCAAGWVISKRRVRAQRARLLLSDIARRAAKAERRAAQARRRAARAGR